MSLRLMVAAFSARLGNPGMKLVLLKLADCANDEGICWPSKKRLAHDTELSESSVKRHICELEKQGWIKAQRRTQDGVNLPTIFYLVGLLAIAEGVGPYRPHPVHDDPEVGPQRPQGWGHGDPLTCKFEPTSEPQQQHTRAHARAYARAEAREPAPPSAAAAMQQKASAAPTPAKGGKARRRRASGIVTWDANDIAEAERIEAEHSPSALAEALAALAKAGLEPVPGRVAQALEKLAKQAQAAAAHQARLATAAAPPPDPEAAARGQAFIQAIKNKRQNKELCNAEAAV